MDPSIIFCAWYLETFASRVILRTMFTGSLSKICWISWTLSSVIVEDLPAWARSPTKSASMNFWYINVIACLSGIFVVLRRCNSRITMTGDSYFAIKITTWILVSKECDILLIWNQNKTLKISLLFKKKLFGLVNKWPRYLIFFLVDEFPDTLYIFTFHIFWNESETPYFPPYTVL